MHRWICLAAVLLPACAPRALSLVVDLKTDLVPGTEFSAVSATLANATTGFGRVAPVFLADDLATGLRIAEYENLAPGDYTLTTDLLDAARTVVVSRVALVSIRDDLAVTMVVSRACRGVTCPRSADPATSTTCAGGSCVDPHCVGSDRSLCPVGCTSDAACSAHAPCSTTRCVEGLCLYFAGSTCTTTERCDPDLGCVPAMITCSTPLLDCGGACTDIEVDEAHCGSCTHACTPPTNAAATCVGGTCGFTCNTGFHHCGADCTAMPCGGSFTSAATSMFPVPEGCTRVDVASWGAGGGIGSGSNATSNPPGAGGFASATLDVTPGEMLTIVVGAPGADGTATMGGRGGAPGGGAGGSGSSSGGGGGGGYTGVFRGAPAQANALVIAGGGGGSGGKGFSGGAGGGFSGETGPNSSAGGSQTAGGLGSGSGLPGDALAGGTAGDRTDGGGGGGAGWYGGGGANGAGSNAAGGGGGSGHVIASARTYALATGNLGTAAANGDPRRGTAGDPGMPGLVLVTCE